VEFLVLIAAGTLHGKVDDRDANRRGHNPDAECQKGEDNRHHDGGRFERAIVDAGMNAINVVRQEFV
jgi:hypothetical protein